MSAKLTDLQLLHETNRSSRSTEPAPEHAQAL